MKKIVLFILTLSLSISGYSQNIIQTTSKKLQDKLEQNLTESLDFNNLESQKNEMNDFDLNLRANKINAQSFQRKFIVNENVTYRLDSLVENRLDNNGIYSKYEYYEY